MTVILPKPYLSYSQMSLWNRDKEAYRLRYYENGPAFENAETIFGKRIAKMLEDGVPHPILDKVPRYVSMEHRIEIPVGGVPFLGVIDSFSRLHKRIIEYKTGKQVWDAVRVSKHDQLVIYSLLAKLEYGSVDPLVRLVWLPTRYKMVTDSVGSRKLEGEGKEIEFTGESPLIFKRRIAEWERVRMFKMIIKCANEISEDYEAYLKKTT